MIFTSVLNRENLSVMNWHQTKRSKFLFQIYVLLNDIDSDDEEYIDNLMNDSGTDFVEREAIKNVESDILEAVTHKKDDKYVSNSIPTTKLIKAFVLAAKPDFEFEEDGDAVPLNNLEKKKILLKN